MIEVETSNRRYERVQQLMSWRKYKEASEEAMLLIREEPEDPDAYALLGRLSLRMENYENALKWSGEALQRDPEHLMGWYVRVTAYYEAENWRAAEQALEDALRIDPYEPYYYFLKASLCNRKGDFKEAKPYILQALDIAPENPLYLSLLSYVEALNRNFSESKMLSSKALRLEVESELVYLQLAWAAERRNDYDDYLLMLKNAIRLDPENKQIREEYLEGLQKSYTLYRILLTPANLAKRMKPWQILLSWFVLWFLFKPLILLFLALYVLTYWGTRLLVHVKVFGWSFKRNK